MEGDNGCRRCQMLAEWLGDYKNIVEHMLWPSLSPALSTDERFDFEARCCDSAPHHHDDNITGARSAHKISVNRMIAFNLAIAYETMSLLLI